MRDLAGKRSVLLFESKQEAKDTNCPFCQGAVYADGYGNVTLKDMPVWYGIAQELTFVCHRYECRQCGKKFTEKVPLQHPGTKVTDRAARWVQAMLRFKVFIRSIQKLTGIHWETQIATIASKTRQNNAAQQVDRPSPAADCSSPCRPFRIGFPDEIKALLPLCMFCRLPSAAGRRQEKRGTSAFRKFPGFRQEKGNG